MSRQRAYYKRRDNSYCEDHYGRHDPYIVHELPLEELNSYQKRLIGALCRRFAAEGAERVTEELDKLQYCSLETALRVAQEGGYLPQDTLNDMEEIIMPKPIMTEETLLDIIRLYCDGVKPAELAERFGYEPKQIVNKIAKAKNDDRYKHLFAEALDKKFEDIIGSVDAGKSTAAQPGNDLDRAAEAIDNYLTEKELTGEITGADLTQKKPQTLTATGEGLIEAADGTVYVDGQSVTKIIADKLQNDFIGIFYGRITVHFEVLPDRDPLIFEIGG